MTNYASLADLKLTVNISDATDDTLLNKALAAASRRIDNRTGRRFDADSVATARLYQPSHYQLLLVDDISTTTGLVVETGRGSSFTIVPSTAYDLRPENAIAKGQPIQCLQYIGGSWPVHSFTLVRVTAKWGFPAIPPEVEQACLLEAARLFKRRKSPEGVTGSSEWGAIRVSRMDPDVEALIAPLALPGFG